MPDNLNVFNKQNKFHDSKRKKSELKLSTEINVLLQRYLVFSETQKKLGSDSNFKVSEVLGRVTFLYERIRNAIDYKRDNLLRRNAIERIIKRQIWESRRLDVDKASDTLLKELIWARYLKNDSFPKSKVKEISKVLSKYLTILDNLDFENNRKKVNNKKEWFIGIASSEIEEILDPSVYYHDVLNRSVFSWFRKKFEWIDVKISEEEKDAQIYLAIVRSVSKSDKERLRYELLKMYIEGWEQLDTQNLSGLMPRISKAQEEIEKYIESPLQPRIFRYVQRQSAAFDVLKEVILNNLEGSQELIRNVDHFESEIRRVCAKRYEEIRKRVNTGVARSIIYIFTSKVLLALVLEVPYEVIFVGHINYTNLGINAIFPPFLMFLVGMSIKKPGKENTDRIIEKIKSFVYKSSEDDRIKFSLFSARRNSILYRVFSLFYLVLSFLIFTGITYLLMELNFNILSGTIFFMFISLVLLFGYRVRYTATELNVTDEKEGFIAHLVSNLTLPFLNLGIWLSEGFSRFNFLIVIMDFLIEAPFKKIISIFEEWTSFIRERKEEAIEVPA